MGNFFITMGIIAMIFLGMILITSIIENFGYICRFVKAVIEVIAERIFKAQTKYYTRKQRKYGAKW